MAKSYTIPSYTDILYSDVLSVNPLNNSWLPEDELANGIYDNAVYRSGDYADYGTWYGCGYITGNTSPRVSFSLPLGRLVTATSVYISASVYVRQNNTYLPITDEYEGRTSNGNGERILLTGLSPTGGMLPIELDMDYSSAQTNNHAVGVHIQDAYLEFSGGTSLAEHAYTPLYSNQEVSLDTVNSNMESITKRLNDIYGNVVLGPGDTLSINNFWAAGMLISDSTYAWFSVPLPRPCVATAVSVEADLRIRDNTGYVWGSSGANEDVTVDSVLFAGNRDQVSVKVKVNDSLVDSTSENTKPVTMEPCGIAGNVTLTFG